LLVANEAGATVSQQPDGEIFEGVYYRPAGSRVTFVWQATSRIDQGEWSIYRGHDIDSFDFVDLTPACRGNKSYRYELQRPLLEREFFQLRYRDVDGSETVVATVLLIGTEFTSGLQPLPDGPPAALFLTPPGWEPPGSTFDLKSVLGTLPLGDRPEPDVPPPQVAG